MLVRIWLDPGVGKGSRIIYLLGVFALLYGFFFVRIGGGFTMAEHTERIMTSDAAMTLQKDVGRVGRGLALSLREQLDDVSEEGNEGPGRRDSGAERSVIGRAVRDRSSAAIKKDPAPRGTAHRRRENTKRGAAKENNAQAAPSRSP